jgi:hypothetical protein
MRALRIVMLAIAMAAVSALPASATHTHVRMTGNGACVVLAADGGESSVRLPHADEFAENRRHPLHVNVHLGEPGTRGGEPVVWVRGSAGDLDNCDGYVND